MRAFNVHKIMAFSKGQRAWGMERLTIEYCISIQRTSRRPQWNKKTNAFHGAPIAGSTLRSDKQKAVESEKVVGIWMIDGREGSGVHS
jgi:hypothetical protein